MTNLGYPDVQFNNFIDLGRSFEFEGAFDNGEVDITAFRNRIDGEPKIAVILRLSNLQIPEIGAVINDALGVALHPTDSDGRLEPVIGFDHCAPSYSELSGRW